MNTLPDDLRATVLDWIGAAPRLAAALSQLPTPCYLFDRAALDGAIRAYRAAFDAHLPRHRGFYAIKANPHPWLLRAMVEGGLGLDAASPEEIALAHAAGAKSVLFSGPGKTERDLEKALTLVPDLIVNADSEGELRRIDAVGRARGRAVRAGLRVYSPRHEEWSKFGEPLSALPRLWRLGRSLPGVQLEGLHVHRSYNNDAAPYLWILRSLAESLRGLSEEERAQIRFLDLGGGYKPAGVERSYGEDTAPWLAGPREAPPRPPLSDRGAVPIEVFAREIGSTIAALPELAGLEILSEPGRLLAARALHFLVRVVDKKRPDLVIADGGIHMVGWERYLFIYCPLVSLTRPGDTELPVRVFGSLCDPEDLLSFSCFGTSVEEGDLLLLPNQGAYTWGMAQNFIRAIPPVFPMPA